ncbi:MAG TPA: ATP-binding cassette domain-containing protein [Thermoprotei archaeon]|nr:ATP-binding cassette domain-containing protein [Thermoprotei archaeon]
MHRMSATASKSYIEMYPVEAPYCYAGIRRETSTNALVYEVVEPRLSEEDVKKIGIIKQYLLEEWVVPLEAISLDREKAVELLKTAVLHVIKRNKISVPGNVLQKYYYYLTRDLIDYGKITPLIRDVNVEDVVCNGTAIPVFVVHRRYGELETNVIFNSEEELDAMVERLAFMANRDISLAKPIVDGMLPNGSRVLITYKKEVSGSGSTFTIRNFRPEPLTIIDLISNKVLEPKEAAYIWELLESKKSVVVIGSTGAGKTTLLNAIIDLIDPQERIVTIEETPELRLERENWVSLHSKGIEGEQSSITLFELLKASLRQRPDYIVVGEIRGEEAVVFFQSIMTGHGGLTTIHADSVDSMINRLISPPISVSPSLIPAVSAVVHISRISTHSGFVRRVSSIDEITSYDLATNRVLYQNYATWNPSKDIVEYGNSVVMESISSSTKRPLKEIYLEVDDKAEILKWMARTHRNTRMDVISVMRDYYANKKEIVIKARLSNQSGRSQ